MKDPIVSKATNKVEDDLMALAKSPLAPVTSISKSPSCFEAIHQRPRDFRQRLMAECRQAATAQINKIIEDAVGGPDKLLCLIAQARLSTAPSSNGDLVLLDGKPLVWIGHPVPVLKGGYVGFTLTHRLV